MAEVNQQQIADRLGLSRATVSRCFTNHAGINPATRAKVFEVAAEIGYTHQETRTASGRQPIKFTVLICSEKSEYYKGDYESPGKQILTGVSEYAQILDASIDIDFVSPTVKSISDLEMLSLQSLKERKDRGVLLIYPFPSKVVDQLAIKYPLVSLVDQHDLNTIDCVDVNHYDGVSLLIDHLVSIGHQRIGFFTRQYPVEASWSFRRYSAFIEKMARMGLQVSPKDVVGIFPTDEPDLQLTYQEVLKQTQAGVTAWVCAADHQAMCLISFLEEHKLNVPEDVAVTGFDGIGRGDNAPPLTTIDIPYREIGMTGAERLAARIGKRFREKQTIYISGKLCPGATTADLK